MTFVFSGFGYELYRDEELPFEQFVVMDAEGDIGLGFNTSFEAKKWMKEHKTSEGYRADGKWDWSRLNVEW